MSTSTDTLRTSWKLPTPTQQARAARLVEEFGLSQIQADLISQLDIPLTAKGIEEFLNPSFDHHIHNPELLTDGIKARDRIMEAIAADQSIMVYADFDTDGMTAGAILMTTLEQVGAKHIDITIPHRNESHGLHNHYIEEFAGDNVDLIITVDCASSDVAQVEYANSFGIDVIITDHHEVPPTLPAAYALINPKREDDTYPCDVLCGAGVSYKLSQLLIRASALPPAQQTALEKWLLDIVAIGTIGDCVPLVGENRTLTTYGLKVIHNTQRPGIHELKKVSEKDSTEPTSEDVAFHMVPRLNATSRLDHAKFGYELLTTTNTAQAKTLARRLDKLNIQRKEITADVASQAKAAIKHKLTSSPDDIVLWAGHSDWPQGINGIVASKIVEEFSRPAFILNIGDDFATASGRSIHGFDITAAIASAGDLLERFGGHPGACGFSIKTPRLDEFFARVQDYARTVDNIDKLTTPSITIHSELGAADINWDTYRQLETLQPFGQDNPRPILGITDAEILSARAVGSDNSHLQIRIGAGEHGEPLAGIGFGFGHQAASLNPGDPVNIAAHLTTNEWNGNVSLQLQILDIHHSE